MIGTDPRIIDMTGQRYGKWTVLGFSRKGERGEFYWNCRCDCGTEKEIAGYSLRRGHSKSCGCWLKEKWKARDLCGVRSGRLLCIGPSEEKNKWKCKCECGNITNVATYSLLSGSTKSCGCIKKEQTIEMNKLKRDKLKGQRFGKLLVIDDLEETKNGSSMCLCLCECGKQKIVRASCLKEGSTTSCGCKKIKYGVSKKGENARLMRIWDGMKDRCFKKNDHSYSNYGGRGITVCNEWKDDFWAFCNWSKNNGYADNLQIDRIDNDGPYSPENCRWVTPKENGRNRRTNVNLTVNGKTQCLSAWAEDVGIKPYYISSWIRRSGEEHAKLRIAELLEQK